ncbi:MAG: leucine-rich repeat protein [Clostridia bacterium]|nr:leucine-rich repeat protein [Clostridia bacterium]
MKRFLKYCALALCLLLISALFACGEPEHIHDYQPDVRVMPTCDHDGAVLYTCSCGATKTEPIAALGHVLGEYTPYEEAACKKDATKSAVCEVCGYRDIVAIEGTGFDHDFSEYTSNGDATCTSDGTMSAICSICGGVDTVTDEGSMHPHSFTEYVSNNDHTCTANGTETAYCDECHTEFRTREDEGSMHPHSFTAYVSDRNATCEADGTKTARCDECTKATDTVADVGSKRPCDYSKIWYSTDNEQMFTACEDCGSIKTEAITEKHHNLSLYAGSPNGAADEDWYVCADCGVRFEVDDVLALTVTKTDEGYCLKVEARHSSVSFSSVGLMCLMLDMDVCDGFDGERPLMDYAPSITELVFGENITSLLDLHSFEYVRRVTASEDLSYVMDKCFSMCAVLSDVYFLGDCPRLDPTSLFKDNRVLDDVSAPSFYVPTLYYMPGAEGYEGYKLQGFTLSEVGAAAPENPNFTVSEYSAATVYKGLEISAEIFADIEASDSLLHLMPFCTLERYKEIYLLANELTEGLSTDREKAEAIFNWITENLTYDMEALYYSVWEVYESRKAVCNGYAILMHDMLCAVGIPSLYIHGITTDAEGLSVSDILDGSNEEKYPDDHHAWLTVYVDGEQILCDPTWWQFDIAPETLSKTRMTLGVYGIDVIPDEYDPRLYSMLVYYDEGNICYMDYGKTLTHGGTTSVFNFSFAVSYEFHIPNDGYIFEGEGPGIYNGYKDTFTDYGNMGYRQMKYYDHSFVCYMYLSVLKYAAFQNVYFDGDITLDYMENFFFGEDGHIYRITSATTAEIVGTVFDGEILTVPERVGGYTVTGVAWGAFDGCYATQIHLPDTVEYIQSTAFWNCRNLRELTLPKNLKTLGVSVFSFCHNLERLVIPASVEFIGLPNNNETCLPYQMFSELSFDKLTVIYEGTREQFDAINFYNPWGEYSGDTFDRDHYAHVLEFIEFAE